jgi:PAS domain S-box-containing protein
MDKFLFSSDPQDIFFRCVEDSNEAIMITDKDGRLAYVNSAWCRIYGFTREEALGQTPRLLHSSTQPTPFYQDMWRNILDPTIGHWKGELLNKAKDGTLVPVLLTITTFRSNGEIAGYMGIAVDMTYKKELEAQLAQQDRLASIGLLASGVAHEVGTPLGVIRGRAEFLLMKAEDQTVRNNLEVITSQIDRISKLIRSLLRVSRNFNAVHLEEISPSAVVSEVLALVGQNLHRDDVEIRVKMLENLKVMADFNRLEQVILNLVMNSIHAIRKAKEDGRKNDHYLLIEAVTIDNGRTTIRVDDSGCGIPPENMKKLFKPFFTTKDVGEGTGLGLAIVAQLMHEMSGRVSVDSTTNRGTSFTLVLSSVNS